MKRAGESRTEHVYQVIETLANVSIAAGAYSPPANGAAQRPRGPVERRRAMGISCRRRYVTVEPRV